MSIDNETYDFDLRRPLGLKDTKDKILDSGTFWIEFKNIKQAIEDICAVIEINNKKIEETLYIMAKKIDRMDNILKKIESNQIPFDTGINYN